MPLLLLPETSNSMLGSGLIRKLACYVGGKQPQLLERVRYPSPPPFIKKAAGIKRLCACKQLKGNFMKTGE